MATADSAAPSPEGSLSSEGDLQSASSTLNSTGSQDDPSDMSKAVELIQRGLAILLKTNQELCARLSKTEIALQRQAQQPAADTIAKLETRLAALEKMVLPSIPTLFKALVQEEAVAPQGGIPPATSPQAQATVLPPLTTKAAAIALPVTSTLPTTPSGGTRERVKIFSCNDAATVAAQVPNAQVPLESHVAVPPLVVPSFMAKASASTLLVAFAHAPLPAVATQGMASLHQAALASQAPVPPAVVPPLTAKAAAITPPVAPAQYACQPAVANQGTAAPASQAYLQTSLMPPSTAKAAAPHAPPPATSPARPHATAAVPRSTPAAATPAARQAAVPLVHQPGVTKEAWWSNLKARLDQKAAYHVGFLVGDSLADLCPQIEFATATKTLTAGTPVLIRRLKHFVDTPFLTRFCIGIASCRPGKTASGCLGDRFLSSKNSNPNSYFRRGYRMVIGIRATTTKEAASDIENDLHQAYRKRYPTWDAPSNAPGRDPSTARDCTFVYIVIQ